MMTSTQDAGRDADLTAIWLSYNQAGQSLGTRIQHGTENGKLILAREIETDGRELVLYPSALGETNPFLGTENAGQENAEVVPYWMRYPADVARRERLDQAPYLFSVRVYAPPHWQQPLREWLDQEHFERQTLMDGVLYGEGYEPLEGPFHFFNLWAIAHPDLINSPEWIRVRDSTWYEDVRPGFQASVVHREIYRVLEPESR